MLELQDVLFTVLHYLIIGLNTLAWIPKKTRKLHLIILGMTFFSWIVLGFEYGFGYCFLTDWHWDVKEQLGELNLPNSFIQYQIEEVFRLNINPELTNMVTALIFVILIIIALWQHLLSAYFPFVKG